MCCAVQLTCVLLLCAIRVFGNEEHVMTEPSVVEDSENFVEEEINLHMNQHDEVFADSIEEGEILESLDDQLEYTLESLGEIIKNGDNIHNQMQIIKVKRHLPIFLRRGGANNIPFQR